MRTALAFETWRVNRSARHYGTLGAFLAYCMDHPEERFWQALRNWTGASFIHVVLPKADYGYTGEAIDTFYWEGRVHNDV